MYDKIIFWGTICQTSLSTTTTTSTSTQPTINVPCPLNENICLNGGKCMLLNGAEVYCICTGFTGNSQS